VQFRQIIACHESTAIATRKGATNGQSSTQAES